MAGGERSTAWRRLGLRPTRSGLFGMALYLAAGMAWLAASHPGGPIWLYASWFILVAGAGISLPGLANQVTLGRAYLAAPGLVYALQPVGLRLLAVTVALAGLSDLVDGAVARGLKSPTRMGGALDPVVDGLFFGSVAVGLAAGGAYPFWLAAAVVLRYLLPALTGWALLGLGREPKLQHTVLGQAATAIIAVLLGWVALWRGLGFDAASIVRGAEVAIPLATLGAFGNLLVVNLGAFAGREQG